MLICYIIYPKFDNCKLRIVCSCVVLFESYPVANSTYEPHFEKTGFLHMENKEADQLHGNHKADQRLCFLHTDSAIPLGSQSKISSF